VSRRAVTLVELLVSMALATILVGVVATLFLQTSDAQRRVLDRVGERQTLWGVSWQMAADGRRAVAISELQPFFRAARIEQLGPTGAPNRADEFEFVFLGEDQRLRRVRYLVEWDAFRRRGVLHREVAPVEASALPAQLAYLASEEPPSSEVLASGVTEFRVRIFDGQAFVDPPVDPDPLWDRQYVVSGLGAVVLHDQVTFPEPLPRTLPAGSLVWLKDDRLQRARFDEGYRRVVRGGLTDVSFGARVGNSSTVFYETAILPAALGLTLRAGGSRHEVTLPLQAASVERDLLNHGRREQQREAEEAAAEAGDPGFNGGGGGGGGAQSPGSGSQGPADVEAGG
jgi:hypothetical protein